MLMTPPGHPYPGHPTPEEVRAVARELQIEDYLVALEVLLHERDHPDGDDAGA